MIASIDARVESLLDSPKAVYLLAAATLERSELEAPVAYGGPGGPVHYDPRQVAQLLAAPVPLDGSPLAQALQDPLRLLMLVFGKVLWWQWDGWSPRVAEHLMDRAGLLESAAQALAESPAAQWWWQPLARIEQTWVYAVEITEVELPFELDLDGLHLNSEPKPRQAFWTSTRVGQLASTWLFHGWEGLQPRQLSVWQIPVGPEARIYEIYGPQDWVTLVQRYPRDVSEQCQWLYQAKWNMPDQPVYIPDWKAVAADYDGVHLTIAGLLTATSRALPVDGGYTLCEGWETESTLWLHPAFGPITRLPDWQIPVPYGENGWPPPAWP